MSLDAPGTLFKRPLVGLRGILDAEGDGAGAGAVQCGEGAGEAGLLTIHDQVHVALPIERHVLGAMPPDGNEAQHLEHLAQLLRFRRGEFHELETAKPHRVLEQVCHVLSPGLLWVTPSGRFVAHAAGACLECEPSQYRTGCYCVKL